MQLVFALAEDPRKHALVLEPMASSVGES
jgi:hypothetical protein